MAKTKRPRGKRSTNVTILCEWCGKRKEVTRQDTKTCTSVCRQRLSTYTRWCGYPPDTMPGEVTAHKAIMREVRRLLIAEKSRRAALAAERRTYLSRPGA